MTNEDINDIKIILNEQLNSINLLGKFRLPPKLEGYEKLRTIYEDILECNKVMMEIVNGPVGGIEKLVERNK
ncbi:MAG: hypothetical protein EBR82_53150 [Caulobacteraceae bacterium]|nr:hypothetical protein [Caulobacteraceae bacterium]